MQVVEGNLILLGNATIQGKITNYSVIEIGDRILQKVRVPRSLDNFLSRALQQNGSTTLYLNGKILCGVRTPEGKIYCYKASPIAGFFLCVCGVPLTLVFGLGLLFIWQGVAELRNASVTGKLQAMGATPISF